METAVSESLEDCNFTRKETPTQVLSCEFCKRVLMRIWWKVEFVDHATDFYVLLFWLNLSKSCKRQVLECILQRIRVGNQETIRNKKSFSSMVQEIFILA